LLVESFPDVFNVEFTAKMEDGLDRVEAAEADSFDILNRFYQPFKNELDAASISMLSLKGIGLPTDLKCPRCSAQLNIKVGKNGQFLACSGYPQCTHTRNYIRDEKGRIRPMEISVEEPSDKLCDKCGHLMVVKQGKYGTFLACSDYPHCKNTLSLVANNAGQETGVNCPEKDCDGHLVQRHSKRGKTFYGCSRYPNCTFAIWDKPVAKACPLCKAQFLVEKSTKKQGTLLACQTKGCGFKEKT
ncbi:MAG: topoisomerase DNA-binding C4 zinc finger domain-containing protein, partial [Proteobacteria bacterium]|nr:topoisomerase DNA-binding C4 zinc finger domain-containing protein [Pseudomonadota bacterium]